MEKMETIKALYPGLLLAGIISLAAQYVADQYGAPAMLMALLFGMSVSSLSTEKTAVSEGLQFTATHILRLGIILLGSKVSSDIILTLGWETISLIVGAMTATILFGFTVGRLFGKTPAFSVLTAGAVAICGASAAIAISCILPKDDDSEKNLIFTILCVTVLSTIAMIGYPLVLDGLGYSEMDAGIFIGATIHDVAQVVGAGFSISDAAGETATLVKLVRVALLVPVVLALSLLFRMFGPETDGAGQKPTFPLFILGFVALAALNSFGLIPAAVQQSAAEISRWALLTAIVAAGAKTNLHEIVSFGVSSTILVVLETLVLAGLVFAGIELLLN